MKREKVKNKVIGFKVTEDMGKRLNNVCSRLKVKRGDFLRYILLNNVIDIESTYDDFYLDRFKDSIMDFKMGDKYGKN